MSTEDTQTSGAPTTKRRPALAAGTRLGRYVIREVLGRGGMGTVYAADDPELRRRVAIKVIDARRDGNVAQSWQQRLAREAHAMARLSHPNVVTVYGVGLSSDGELFLAMEWIKGGTLKQWLAETNPRWQDVLRVFVQAGEGLAAAHAAGIVHRDFKPDNVLLGEDGRARVTDFGLARAVGAEANADALPAATADELRTDEIRVGGEAPTLADRPSLVGADRSATPLTDRPSPVGSDLLATPLTRAGTIMGTPGYMAPELYRAEPADQRSDVFAFCASLYQALYRQRPFDGVDVDDLERAVAAGRVREPPKTTRVPAYVHRVLLAGLAADRAARLRSMRAVLDALSAAPRARRRWQLALVAAATLALAALAWVRAAPRGYHARPCPDESARLSGIWDDATKSILERAFLSTGRSWAAESWGNVRRMLDHYAGEWTRLGVQSCQEAELRGERDRPIYARRTACLDERLDGLRAVTELLAGGDEKVLAHATTAVAQLDELSVCAEAAKLSTIPLLPADAQARREIEALRREFQKAHVLAIAVEDAQSLALLQHDLQRVVKTGYSPLIVRWMMQLALQERSDDEKAAIRDLRETIVAAERSNLDYLKARAEIHLGSFLGSQLGRTREGHEWMRQADATIARLGSEPYLASKRDVEEGWIDDYEHKLDEAATLFDRALAEIAASPLHDLYDEASARSGLAECRVAQGRYDEAIAESRRALDVMIAVDGPHHPSLSGYWNNLAFVQLEVGRPEEALTTARQAVAALDKQVQAGDIKWHASSLGVANETLGEVLLRLGRLDEAVAVLRRSLGIYKHGHGLANPDVAMTDAELARALRQLGRLDEARRAIAEAHAVERAVTELPATTTAAVLTEEAQLLVNENRAQAVALLERALSMVVPSQMPPRDYACMQLALAKALLRTDRARSRSLLGEAQATFAKLHDREMLEETGRLLASATERRSRGGSW